MHIIEDYQELLKKIERKLTHALVKDDTCYEILQRTVLHSVLLIKDFDDKEVQEIVRENERLLEEIKCQRTFGHQEKI